MDEGALPYGSFGRASYNPDEKEWYFRRSLQSSSLTPLGSSKCVGPPTAARSKASAVVYQDVSQGFKDAGQIRHVLKTFPDLQPASQILPSLLKASEAVVNASSRHDPAKASLLAHGDILQESSRRSVPAIAHATGSTGSDLRISLLLSEQRGWSDTKNAWIDVPVPRGEEVICQGKPAPIQQIVFGESVESAKQCLLAVRQRTAISIYRPVLRKASTNIRSGLSMLDPNLHLEICLDESSDLAPSDVAFNPWYNRQLSIVNQGGVCSLWEMEGRDSVKAKVTAQFCLDSDTARAKVVADGWARTTWLLNPTTLVVSTRLEAALFDISSSPVELQTLKLDLDSGIGWILDIVALPSKRDHLAVLTGTHITFWHARQSLDGAVEGYQVYHAALYFNQEDISLRLNAFTDTYGVTVLVSSSASNLFINYTVQFDSNGVLSVSSPSQMDILRTTASESTSVPVTGLHLQPVRVAQKGSSNVNESQIALYEAHNVQFYSMTALHSDLSLSQRLYCCARGKDHDLTIEPPTWEKRQGNLSTAAPRERFVVADEDPEIYETVSARTRPASSFVERKRRRTSGRTTLDWTVNNEDLAERLQKLQADPVEFDEVLKNWEETFSLEDVESGLPWHLLCSISEQDVSLDEVDAGAARLQAFHLQHSQIRDSDNNEQAQTFQIQSLSTKYLGHADAKETATSLQDIYDKIVMDWISPLDQIVPGRVRLAKERLARRMAADVALASYVVRPVQEEPSRATQSTEPTGQPLGQTWDIPVRATIAQGGESGTHMAGSSSPHAGVGALPTPRTTPSVATATSSHPSTFASAEVAWLARYTSFSQPLPAVLPRALNRVLSHWQPGTSPAEYNWLSSRSHLARQEEIETAESQQTEKERRRLQKHAERLLRKQRKENQTSQTQSRESSRVPELTISSTQQYTTADGQRSQPGVLPGELVGSSQTAGPSGSGRAVASQVVPGKYGGRPPVKKKRKQGF